MILLIRIIISISQRITKYGIKNLIISLDRKIKIKWNKTNNHAAAYFLIKVKSLTHDYFLASVNTSSFFFSSSFSQGLAVFIDLYFMYFYVFILKSKNKKNKWVILACIKFIHQQNFLIYVSFKFIRFPDCYLVFVVITWSKHCESSSVKVKSRYDIDVTRLGLVPLKLLRRLAN